MDGAVDKLSQGPGPGGSDFSMPGGIDWGYSMTVNLGASQHGSSGAARLLLSPFTLLRLCGGTLLRRAMRRGEDRLRGHLGARRRGLVYATLKKANLQKKHACAVGRPLPAPLFLWFFGFLGL